MARGPRKGKHKCQHVSTRRVGPCPRWAVIRNMDDDLWLCSIHKDWVPGGRVARKHDELSDSDDEDEAKKAKRYHLRKKNRLNKQKRKYGLQRCGYTTKSGAPCHAIVAGRTEDGVPVCQKHAKVIKDVSESDRALMENQSIKAAMKNRIKKLRKVEDENRIVVDMPTIQEQYEVLEKMADAKDDFSIRFKKSPENPTEQPTAGTGKKYSHFYGIDVEHYTPEFKYDYMYMMMTAIRRAEAQVNIYFQQLQRIEAEEEEIKQTIREGTMVSDGNVVEFKNVESRNAIPIELKLKLMDNLTKAESHYAKLLKEMREMPLVALMVLQRMGVRWDRKASMMVIEKLEKQESQILTDFSLNPSEPQQIPLEAMFEVIQEDPSKIKQVKKLAQDDDW